MAKKKDLFNPFENAGNPDVTHELDGLTLNVYFVDNYDFKDDILEKQMTFVNTERTAFSVMLEKDLYDAVPELYNAEALKAQHTYFHHRTTMNLWKFFLGGILLFGAVFGIMQFFSDIQSALFGGAIVGMFYMIAYFFRTLKKDMVSARFVLRENMIKIFGEKKLDELLDKQQEIAEQKGYKF